MVVCGMYSWMDIPAICEWEGRYFRDFFMNLIFLLFSSAPFTDWRGDALNAEVALGKAVSLVRVVDALGKKQTGFKLSLPHQDCDPEACLPAWTRRLCVGLMNFPQLSQSVCVHVAFPFAMPSVLWLPADNWSRCGRKKGCAEQLTWPCCHSSLHWHWSSQIPECCF